MWRGEGGEEGWRSSCLSGAGHLAELRDLKGSVPGSKLTSRSDGRCAGSGDAAGVSVMRLIRMDSPEDPRGRTEEARHCWVC